MKDITKEEWKKQLENDDRAVILDVRTDEEFEEGYIPNATQLDIQDPARFMQKIAELDKSKNYYIYCRSGGRSLQACQLLDQMGVAQTYNLLGGYSEWDGERVE